MKAQLRELGPGPVADTSILFCAMEQQYPQPSRAHVTSTDTLMSGGGSDASGYAGDAAPTPISTFTRQSSQGESSLDTAPTLPVFDVPYHAIVFNDDIDTDKEYDRARYRNAHLVDHAEPLLARDISSRTKASHAATSFYSTPMWVPKARTASHDTASGYYPLDERGEEMNENARVWRIYVDEATKVDSSMIDRWNRGLDVLLVFCGLFSAVVTTFIIQSFQMVLPGSGDVTNQLLVQIIALQSINTTQVTDDYNWVNQTSSNPVSIYWVNGLWFAALAVSLASALVAMMAKQWIQAYDPSTSGSARQRARLQQRRRMQLMRWRVPAIIDALPILLHASLLLFFCGVVTLLWSNIDHPVTLLTLLIVAFCYVFYAATVLIPLIWPNCPYYHPLTRHIVAWTRRLSGETLFNSSMSTEDEEDVISYTAGNVKMKDEDRLDAQAVCWLLRTSRDDAVLVATLQALAGLPRDFTAIEIFHKADVIHRIEGAFQSCFSIDSTITLRWHALDIDSAELFCRAWLKLAISDSNIFWPKKLFEPLELMEKLSLRRDAAAVACCVHAFSQPTRPNVWNLLDRLTCAVSLEYDLSLETQCLLIDTFIECIIKWEQASVIVEETKLRAIPTLIHVIRLANDMGVYSTGGAAALALHLLIMGPIDIRQLRNDTARRDNYCEVMLQSLYIIARAPERYGINDEPTKQILTMELTELTLPVLEDPGRFSHPTKVAVHDGLTRLLLGGQIRVGRVPDTALSHVLQLLYPPMDLEAHQYPRYLFAILDILSASREPNVIGFALRNLECLISNPQISTCVAFISHGGLATLSSFFRNDQGRIASESVRIVCVFIDAITVLRRRDTITNAGAGYPEFVEHCEATFNCGFFDAFCALVSSGQWRFNDVVKFSRLGALVRLCCLSPAHQSWPQVIATLQDVADRHSNSEDYEPTLSRIEAMRKAISGQSTPALRSSSIVRGGPRPDSPAQEATTMSSAES